MLLNEIKESDLLLVKKSFYYTDVDPNFKKVNYNHDKIKKGNILLVIENNFGATYKDRFVICLYNNKLIYFNSRGLNTIHSSQLTDCFELVSIKEKP